jgi:hypothetical protein
MSSSHFIEVCRCGEVVAQCRCADCNKVRIVKQDACAKCKGSAEMHAKVQAEVARLLERLGEEKANGGMVL